MRRIALIAPLGLLVLGLTACVPKGKYQALQSELDGTRTTAAKNIAAKDAAIAGRDSAIAALKKQVADADGQIADLQAEKEQLSGEVSALNDEKAKVLEQRGKLRASVEEMKQALADLQARKAAADKRMRAYRDLLGRFKKLIQAGRLQVKIIDGRMVVQMATDVLFPSGSANLSDQGKAAIAQVGAVLASIPGRRYQVEGHTDNVPIHTDRFPSNWELASARALTVVRALISAGVSADRVSGASYGDTRPVAPNETPEGRAQNRRIEIVVVPDLSMLPGAEELQAASSGAPEAAPATPEAAPATPESPPQK